MDINIEMLARIREFFMDTEIDEGWMLRHITVDFSTGNTMVIKIDNMNEQDFNWIRQAN